MTTPSKKVVRKKQQSGQTVTTNEDAIREIVNELKLINGLQEAQSELIHTQFENLGNQVNDVKEQIRDVKNDTTKTRELVNTQNGRIGKLEENKEQAIRDHIRDRDDIDKAIKAHLNCPGSKVMAEFNDYRKKMQPLYVIATSLKIFIYVIILTILLTIKFPGIKKWVIERMPSQIEIGI